MKISEELLFSYSLNFVSVIVLLLCFKWCREYLPFTVAVAISSVLAAQCKIYKIENPYIIELIFVVTKSACLAMPLSFALESLPFAGRMIDVFRGMQFAEISFGQNNSRNSILESGLDLFSAMMFLKFDFFLLLMERYFTISRIELNQSMFFNLLKISSTAFLEGFLIALPILIICISIELLSVLLAKVNPRLNILNELNSAKALLGIGAIYLTFEYLPERFLKWLQVSLSQLPLEN